MLSATERSLRSRIAGYSRAALYDGRVVTEKARATFISSFETQVDPDGILAPQERERRATAARQAHMARLALKSVQSRRQRKEQRKAGGGDA